jgi:hypothetical protein
MAARVGGRALQSKRYYHRFVNIFWSFTESEKSWERGHLARKFIKKISKPFAFAGKMPALPGE